MFICLETYTRMSDYSKMARFNALVRKNWKPMAIGGAVFLIILIVIIAVTVPKHVRSEQISIDEQLRVDCHPDRGASESCCLRRGCVWDPNASNSDINAPQCYYPPNYGYTLVTSSEAAGLYELKKSRLPGEETSIGKPVEELTLKVEFGDGIAHLKFTDKHSDRYEVPIKLPIQDKLDMRDSSDQFRVTFSNGSLLVDEKQEQGRRLLDTSIGGFVYNDQFLQIATYLSGDVLYGFGENPHRSLRHNLTAFQTWPMFARDQPPYPTPGHLDNTYGVHPFCIVINNKGQAYGLLFWNSNAQEYTTGPAPSLVYRTIGGILDVYIFLGPTGDDVVRQYWSLIGKPALPTYWSLGFQLCRYGYNNTAVVRDVMDRMRQMRIPQDVQYVDIDYMQQCADFTLDQTNFKDLPDLVKETRQDHGMRWVFIIDPALDAVRPNYEPFLSARDKGLLISWPNQSLVPDLNDRYENTRGTSIMLGTVWPSHNVAFPNFLNPDATSWWSELIVKFHDLLPFDGLWIDMNEPANFGTNEEVPWYVTLPELKDIPQLMCPDNTLDKPPYPTQAAYVWNTSLAGKTLCMLARQGSYSHYDVHNLYGWSETQPSLRGVQEATKSRGFLLSRSTFPSSGHFAGHWLGDNSATWDDMRISIVGMLEFNLFGIPYVGADICGFLLNTNEELCARWQQLGAFYPFSRNHNGKDDGHTMFIEQDPTRWPLVALATRNSLNLRYYYLPYLYTLFYKANQQADMVVRPLSFVFASDPKTVDIDRQFMWGPAMLISPCLEPNVSHVEAYFPDAVWYRIDEQQAEGLITEPGLQMLRAPLAGAPPVHVRGGFIIPRQQPDLNTQKSRQNDMELLIALPKQGVSVGELYWDDGESIDTSTTAVFFKFEFNFNSTDMQLHINKQLAPETHPQTLPDLCCLQFFGVAGRFDISSFKIDNDPLDLVDSNVEYDPITNVVTVKREKLIKWAKVKSSSVLQWKLAATGHSNFW